MSRLASIPLRILLTLFLILTHPGLALGAAGDVDTGFDPNLDGFIYAIAIQTDGRIVIGGSFGIVSGIERHNLARLNSDGTLDLTFNPGADGLVNSIAVQMDGKILIGGEFRNTGGVGRNRIARLNPDGTIDAPFSPNADNDVLSLVVQPDGKIIVGGVFTSMNGATRTRIARLNVDGTIDPQFAPSVNSTVASIVLQPDGDILIAGNLTAVAGIIRNRIARLSSEGVLDQSFNPNSNGYVYSIAVEKDGRVLIVGGFTSVGGVSRNKIARLNSAGSVDSSFDPNVQGFTDVYSLTLQADGKILLGGGFTTVGGVVRNNIARLNPDGTLDGTFNPNSDGTIFSTIVESGGKVVIGGTQQNVGGIRRNRIARLENDPATQALTVTSTSRLRWLRGGTAPEVEQVSFELSTDGGANWGPLGFGTRIAGGWERTSLSLPGAGQVRARGRTTAGIYNGSSGLVEQVAPFSFTSAPTAATGIATDVTTTTATLNGSVNPNGAGTTAFFEYGLTTSYGSTTAAKSVGSGTSAVAVSEIISGLTANTTYHFRLVASNATGTINGADVAFTTQDIPTGGVPTVVTGAASDVRSDSATVSGAVNPNGLATAGIVEYGLTTAYGSSEPVTPAPGSGVNSVAVSAALTGLLPETLYHYRFSATNAQGTTNAADATFATPVAPTVNPQPDAYFVGVQDESLPVLENDGDPSLTIVSVAGAAFGTASPNAGNTAILYSPGSRIFAEDPRDTLVYRVRDPVSGQEAGAGVDVWYFLGLRGSFSGSFIGGLGSAEFGRVDLDLTRTGMVTGSFEWQGGSYPFIKDVDLHGRLTVEKPKAGGGGSLALELTLDPARRELRGTFTDSSAQPRALIADVAISGTSFVPFGNFEQAAYTAFIEPPPVVEGSGDDGQFPPDGVGFSIVRVSKKGKARFAGKLSDAENLSQGFKGAVMEEDTAVYPFDQSLYVLRGTERGSLEGDVRLETAQQETMLDSVLTHRRDANVGSAFINGFTILTALDGRRFPGSGSGLPPGYTERSPNAKVRLRGGGLAKEYEGLLRITSRKVIVMRPPEVLGEAGNAIEEMKIKFGTTRKAGLGPSPGEAIFRGSFLLPTTGEKVKFIGGVHGNGGKSRGVFKTTDRTGRIEIVPN